MTADTISDLTADITVADRCAQIATECATGPTGAVHNLAVFLIGAILVAGLITAFGFLDRTPEHEDG